MKIMSTINFSKLKRKIGWFLVLMLWVGMVTAVIVHKRQKPNDELARMSSAEGYVEIETTTDKSKKQKSENIDEIGAALSSDSISVAKVENKAKNKGKDFFVEYRIERDQARSEQINLLREMINNPNSDKKLKSQAQERLLQLTNNIEKEMEIESLIRARGYQDGIAFIHNQSIELIIATTGLKRKDVAKIADIVANSTGISLENITIIEKKPE